MSILFLSEIFDRRQVEGIIIKNSNNARKVEGFHFKTVYDFLRRKMYDINLS